MDTLRFLWLLLHLLNFFCFLFSILFFWFFLHFCFIFFINWQLFWISVLYDWCFNLLLFVIQLHVLTFGIILQIFIIVIRNDMIYFLNLHMCFFDVILVKNSHRCSLIYFCRFWFFFVVLLGSQRLHIAHVFVF